MSGLIEQLLDVVDVNKYQEYKTNNAPVCFSYNYIFKIYDTMRGN